MRSSSGRLSIPAAPHCVVLQRWRWGGLQLGRRAGASEVTRAARSSAASSLSPVWQSALGLFLGPPGIWISSPGGKKKVAGPGLEPTTLGSSTQHLNHSDTRARCFGGLHFHSSECAWRFLQLGAGGTRRSAAAARATSDLPKSKWGIAALEVVALGACSLPCVGFSTWGSWHYPSLHVGLCAVSLRLGVWWSPCSRLARPPGCRIPHRRRVVFSSVDGGFLLRSAAGWGFARRLELSPTRMEPSPRSVPLRPPVSRTTPSGSPSGRRPADSLFRWA